MIIQDTIYTHASTPHRKDMTRTGLNPSKSHAWGLGHQNDRLVEAFKEALLSPAILRHRAEFCQGGCMLSHVSMFAHFLKFHKLARLGSLEKAATKTHKRSQRYRYQGYILRTCCRLSSRSQYHFDVLRLPTLRPTSIYTVPARWAEPLSMPGPCRISNRRAVFIWINIDVCSSHRTATYRS